MATMTFADDTVSNVPGASAIATFSITGLSTAPYTFNPFGTDIAVTDGGGDDEVTLRLIFANTTSTTQVDGATLYHTVGGTESAMLLNSTFTMIGTAAETQAWLNTMYIVGYSLNDGMRLLLRSVNDVGGTQGTNTQLTYILACFHQGTMIGTPAGERAVETLQAGDLVTTLDGSAKKVKWVGHRTYEAEFGAGEAFVRPVLFRAGALGGGLPTRDLRVSPQHGMLIDGVMVPAAALVNGVSIVRDTSVSDVTYFHVELEGHEAIFAEGAPSETFVDHDSRAIFDNADEYSLLFGTATSDVAELPRLEEGFELAAIRARLAGIAGIAATAVAGPLMGNLERIEDGVLHGWMIDTAGADAVEAEVLVDGETVARVVANRYRADLDQAGLAGGRGGFTVAVPAQRLAQISLRRIGSDEVLAAPMAEIATV